jgi:hypothetical protein
LSSQDKRHTRCKSLPRSTMRPTHDPKADSAIILPVSLVRRRGMHLRGGWVTRSAFFTLALLARARRKVAYFRVVAMSECDDVEAVGCLRCRPNGEGYQSCKLVWANANRARTWGRADRPDMVLPTKIMITPNS